jgi:hypothetical protein
MLQRGLGDRAAGERLSRWPRRLWSSHLRRCTNLLSLGTAALSADDAEANTAAARTRVGVAGGSTADALTHVGLFGWARRPQKHALTEGTNFGRL